MASVLVAAGLQGWLLWEAARSFPHVRQNQSLVALKMDILLAKAGPTRNGDNKVTVRL